MKHTNITNFETLKTTYPKVSLKKICEVTNVCYQYVLKASKKPIPNTPYDPTSINYDEVDKIFERKGIDLSSFDWETIENEITTIIPINKVEDFTVGKEFTLRETEEKKGTIYSVIYTTETHIVFMSNESTQPRVMNWDTFVHQSPRIEK